MTISQLMQLPPGSPVPVTAGRITGVSAYEKGDEWTLQTLMIEDASGSIPVRIGHHDEIPQKAIGSVLVFTAVPKPNGSLIGLRVQEETYEEGGLAKKCRTLEMTRAGVIMSEEQWAQAQAQAAATAPATTQAQQPAQPTQTTAQAEQASSTTNVHQNLRAQVTGVSEVPAATEKKATGKLGKIVEITYGITVNTGNYCSERAEVRVEVGDDAKASEVIAAAKQFLRKNLPEEAVPAGGRQMK